MKTSESFDVSFLDTLLECRFIWTLTEATQRRLEMWVYRRILSISWVDRVYNETVLERIMNKEKGVINTIN